MIKKGLWGSLLAVMLLVSACAVLSSESGQTLASQDQQEQVSEAQKHTDAAYEEIAKRSASQAVKEQVSEAQKHTDAAYEVIARRSSQISP